MTADPHRRRFATLETDDGSDDLLAALDQLSNAVHWLCGETGLRAADAIVDALDEWVGEHPIPQAGHGKPGGRSRGLNEALSTFVATVSQVSGPGGPKTELALTEALVAWTSGASAEHRQSRPFQRPALSSTDVR